MNNTPTEKDKNGITFSRNIVTIGNSKGVTLPKEILEFCDMDEGTEITMTATSGKHGKYVAFWKK